MVHSVRLIVTRKSKVLGSNPGRVECFVIGVVYTVLQTVQRTGGAVLFVALCTIKNP